MKYVEKEEKYCKLQTRRSHMCTTPKTARALHNILFYFPTFAVGNSSFADRY